MKKLLKRRKSFIINNPILSSYLGFIKGVFLTILIYELILS